VVVITLSTDGEINASKAMRQGKKNLAVQKLLCALSHGGPRASIDTSGFHLMAGTVISGDFVFTYFKTSRCGQPHCRTSMTEAC